MTPREWSPIVGRGGGGATKRKRVGVGGGGGGGGRRQGKFPPYINWGEGGGVFSHPEAWGGGGGVHNTFGVVLTQVHKYFGGGGGAQKGLPCLEWRGGGGGGVPRFSNLVAPLLRN